MTDYIAKIRAKGLDSTGVTEEVARKMHANRGAYYMAIVELKVKRTDDDDDGQHGVDLILTQVEPATDTKLDDHLRELCRALHAARKLHGEDEQPQLDGVDDIEPKVSDVIARGQALAENGDQAADQAWEYPAGEGHKGDHIDQTREGAEV